MNKNNDLNSQLPAIREALESGKKVEFETHGFSMIPLLHDGGDKVILELNSDSLKVNDIALCKTDKGKYVLHRVIEITDKGYILKGDNSVNTELCLSDNDVVGVVCSIIRRNKIISVTDKQYLFYVRNRAVLLKLWRLFWRFTDFFVKLVRKK